MGGRWDTRIKDSESGKARGLVKANLEEMFHRSDSDYLIVWLLSLWACFCVYRHVLYPFCLLISTLLVSLLSVSMWKFISMQLMGQGLVSGLGFRALTVMAWLQSVAGNRNPASNHCCPRPSEISLTVLTRKLLPNVKEELIMEVWCLFESESEEEGGLLPQLPLFLWL